MKKIKRKCQGCNQTLDRNDLVKITKLKNGMIKINPSSTELGRSVYVCKNMDCVKNFIKKKRLRNLKINNTSEILKIEEELKTYIL